VSVTGLDPVTALYRVGSVVARTLPRSAADALAKTVYRVASEASQERRMLVERNVRRVLGDDLPATEVDRLVRLTFEAYGRYWVDSFRLPDMPVEEVDAGMDLHGFEHVAQSIADGYGPIMLLPHLGSWEWAGFWVPQVADIPITVVVEPVEPPALFEFFVSYRRQLGMNVVPLGPTVTAEALKAIKARHMLCLLCDRDLEGTGVEVEFFGERTTLPGGPAMLGLRTGAPLLPTACYFKDTGINCTIKPPIPCERTGRLRDDVARITQDIAHALEDLIRVAPEQWHLQQPNWPSDWDALAAIGKPYPKPGEQ
jgi:KDO2-lipid IV(A) lauroyltransferase